MRPQRVPIIGSSSGLVTLKKPCSETSSTLFHCSPDIPAIGASACIPALLTTICTGPSASSLLSARAVSSSFVISKATASAAPPAARIFCATCSACARLRFACTATRRPAAASRRQIAAPIAPLPPVTSALIIDKHDRQPSPQQLAASRVDAEIVQQPAAFRRHACRAHHKVVSLTVEALNRAHEIAQGRQIALLGF